MAICITHTNKTNQTYPIQVLVKDGARDVETVNLGPNQEFWVESNKITSSIRVYQRKGLVSLKENANHKGVRFLVPYTIGEAPVKEAPKPTPKPETTINPVHTLEGALDETAKQSLAGKDANPLDILAEAREEMQKETPEIPGPFDQPQETSISSLLDKAVKQVEEYTESELKTGKWEDDEITYLKRYYPSKGAKFVAEKLNRGDKSVSKKAEALKLKRKRK